MPPENSPSSELPATKQRRPGSDPLERLRQHVEQAATELERLREENAQLAARVRDLGEEPLLAEARPPASTADLLEGDPEALREKIQRFIAALDRVLAERATPPPAE